MPKKNPGIQHSKADASVLSALISRKGAIVVAIIVATGTILAAMISKWSGENQRPIQGEPYKYVGKVLDKATGNNIREAKVSLETSGDVPAVVFTDSEGIFSFPLKDPTRKIHLRVEVVGYEKINLSVVPANIDGIQVIPLSPAPSPTPTHPTQGFQHQEQESNSPKSSTDPNRKGGTIIEPESSSVVNGTVVDADTGKPILAARVYVDRHRAEAVTTDDDGAFTLRTHTTSGQMFWLRADKKGYVPKQVMHQTGDQDATIRLSKE